MWLPPPPLSSCCACCALHKYLSSFCCSYGMGAHADDHMSMILLVVCYSHVGEREAGGGLGVLQPWCDSFGEAYPLDGGSHRKAVGNAEDHVGDMSLHKQAG